MLEVGGWRVESRDGDSRSGGGTGRRDGRRRAAVEYPHETTLKTPSASPPDVSKQLARLDAAIARADDQTAAHLRELRESLLAVARGEGRQLTDAEFQRIYAPRSVDL